MSHPRGPPLSPHCPTRPCLGLSPGRPARLRVYAGGQPQPHVPGRDTPSAERQPSSAAAVTTQGSAGATSQSKLQRQACVSPSASSPLPSLPAGPAGSFLPGHPSPKDSRPGLAPVQLPYWPQRGPQPPHTLRFRSKGTTQKGPLRYATQGPRAQPVAAWLVSAGTWEGPREPAVEGGPLHGDILLAQHPQGIALLLCPQDRQASGVLRVRSPSPQSREYGNNTSPVKFSVSRGI